MSKPSTTALAVGAGYVLGRKRRLRMTAVLALAALTGSAGGLAGRALRGAGQLLSSPQVLDKLPPEAAKLADLVRGDLAQAGKSAAQAALSSRINGWTSALHDQAETIRTGNGDGAAAGGKQGRGQRREDESEEAGPRGQRDGARRRRPAADRSDGRRRGADRQPKTGSARGAGR